jgi:pSer/pThr/pTyr-binding forkhead associated (FHA) protein
MKVKMFPCVLELHLLNKDGDYIKFADYNVINSYTLNKIRENLKKKYALHNKDYRMYIVTPSKANDLIATKSNNELDKLIENFISEKEYIELSENVDN